MRYNSSMSSWGYDQKFDFYRSWDNFRITTETMQFYSKKVTVKIYTNRFSQRVCLHVNTKNDVK